MLAGLPKNVVQRYFFQFRVPLRYKDIERLLSLLSRPDYDVASFPKRYSATTLLQIKRALEDCRRNEGLLTRAGAEAEANLVEAAADMGDPKAIALLCGARMRQADATPEDMESGSDLLRQLMDAQLPLAFKVSGDLAYSMGRPREAEQFYRKALALDLDDARLEVECWRNLGHLCFKAADLRSARTAFDRACQLADDPKQVLDCHFLLAQLREPDRQAARQHLEAAAAFGFQDAFLPLGALLLNWFGEAVAAREWFRLASTTDQTGAALVGLLDTAVRLEDWTFAEATIARIGALPKGDELLATRQHAIEQVKQRAQRGTTVDAIVRETAPERSGRFDL